MAVGAAPARCNAAIDAAVALGTWIKPHVGDPGAAGTANPATETTRHQATMAAASGGSAASTVDLSWTGVAATETWTHFSMWTASSGGTFLWSGTITGGSVLVGSNFTISAGNLTLTATGAA
jgi:hypothetical protein